MARNFTFLIVILIFLKCNNEVFSIDFSKTEINSNLPKIVGSSNSGTEFYLTFIPSWENSTKNDIKIYVSSEVRTKVVVNIPSKGIILTDSTIPNGVIEFTLTPDQGQPCRKTDRESPQKDQIFANSAIHITSDDPIICYGVTRYGYTSGGYLAKPVSKLGKEYIVASWADPADNYTQWLTSYTAVVGTNDTTTKVRFTMGGSIASKTVSGLKPGEVSYWNLNKGDVLLIGALGAHSEITGSKITANKPFGVISGNFCAYIPTDCGCCDLITEMENPTNTWGNTYHVTNIINRKKNSLIKIFAKETKTNIYRDGAKIGYIRDAGGMEGDGWLSIRASDSAVRPVVISGDKPINVVQFNSAQGDDLVKSDPFQLNLTPTGQYSKEISFCIPGIKDSVNYTSNYINLCYQATNDGKIPDDLMIGKLVNGSIVWSAINATDINPGKEFAIPFNGQRYFAKTILLPAYGAYKIKANKPLTGYLYGFSEAESYAYPVSFDTEGVENKDIYPPDPKWTMDCSGTVNPDKLTKVRDMPDDIYFRSNLGVVYLRPESSFNYKAHVTDYMRGEARETVWWLEVIDKSKDAKATMTFTDVAGNDTTIIINYNSIKTRIQPNKKVFGVVGKDSSVIKTFWVVNDSPTIPTNIVSLELLKKNQGFELLGADGGAITLPVTLNPLDSLSFKVKFTCSLGGIFIDSIGVGDTCMTLYKTRLEAIGDVVGVEEDLVQEGDMKVFPNPSDGNTIIDFGNFENVSLMLYNELGTGIEIPVEHGKSRIELKGSDLASGVYHLVMRSGTDVVVRKLVIQK